MSYLFFLLNSLYTRNILSPEAEIGPGLVFGLEAGVGLTKNIVAGENCTFHGCSVVTLAFDGIDIDKEKVIFGDYCVIGSRSKIMRPIKLADGTQITENSVVFRSTENPGTLLSGFPARKRASVELEQVKSWNPLYGGLLIGADK
jgi:serine acetyltransferase